MQRCDFASVMAIIRDDLIEGAFSNQMDFVDKLFASIINEEGMFFDQGLVNKWFNGLGKVSPQVCQFYAVDEDGTKSSSNACEKILFRPGCRTVYKIPRPRRSGQTRFSKKPRVKVKSFSVISVFL